MVGIVQYGTFLDWLLSLSNRHLSSLHVFSGLDGTGFQAWLVRQDDGLKAPVHFFLLLRGILVASKFQ